MGPKMGLAMALCVLPATLSAPADDPVAVFTEHPRLLLPPQPLRLLECVRRAWWAIRPVAALKAGRHVIAREDAYPLCELMHALRESTTLDLRESYPRFFKEFPIEHLISHYPVVYEAPENDYRIGAMTHSGDPNPKTAALSRAPELAMVALDVHAAAT